MSEARLADPEVVRTLGLDQQGGQRRRRWPWIVAIAAVVVVVIAAWFLFPRGQGAWTYDTAEATRGELTVTVTAVGVLEPVNTVDVSSELSGIVESVEVDANDTVKSGQILARLDTSMLRAQLDQARATVRAGAASLDQARINVDATQSDLERARTLSASGAIAPATLEASETAQRQAVAAVALAEAQLQQTRASLSAAESNLDKATILAPIDGVVLERNIEPGQAVVSALQAATLFRVAEDLHRMGVDVEVDEADIGRVVVGQRATFSVAAYPERVFDAVVHKVHLAPRAGQQVVTYQATLHLQNEDQALFPGMTATALIVADTLSDVVLVPNAALRFTPPDAAELPPPTTRDGRRHARVWTLEDGAVAALEIVPVATDGVNTSVEGVEPGTVLVTAATPRRRGSP